jgi:uncharacterized protein (TIGR02466 family)
MSPADTPRTKIDIQPLFATPVAFAPLLNANTINATLRTTILARSDSHPSAAHSNLGGWQSSRDLPEWGGAETELLLSFVRQLADKFTADRTGQPAPQDWQISAWANVNRAGHGNEFHTHPGCMWSAVYYVDDGGTVADPSLGGEFEIQDPRGVAPAMYRPDLVPAVPGGAAMGASEMIQPVAGTLMMFPSWVSHAVRPYTGEGTRISIAINLS